MGLLRSGYRQQVRRPTRSRVAGRSDQGANRICELWLASSSLSLPKIIIVSRYQITVPRSWVDENPDLSWHLGSLGMPGNTKTLVRVFHTHAQTNSCARRRRQFGCSDKRWLTRQILPEL